jgi:hypothetical protein
MAHILPEVSQPLGHTTGPDCPNGSYISSLTTSPSEKPGGEWFGVSTQGVQHLAPCDEADSPAWVDAWLEQALAEPTASLPVPTLSLAEIRQTLGYRQ